MIKKVKKILFFEFSVTLVILCIRVCDSSITKMKGVKFVLRLHKGIAKED